MRAFYGSSGEAREPLRDRVGPTEIRRRERPLQDVARDLDNAGALLHSFVHRAKRFRDRAPYDMPPQDPPHIEHPGWVRAPELCREIEPTDPCELACYFEREGGEIGRMNGAALGRATAGEPRGTGGQIRELLSDPAAESGRLRGPRVSARPLSLPQTPLDRDIETGRPRADRSARCFGPPGHARWLGPQDVSSHRTERAYPGALAPGPSPSPQRGRWGDTISLPRMGAGLVLGGAAGGVSSALPRFSWKSGSSEPHYESR